MKTDLYTKTLLTVITVCLTIIVIKQVDIIPGAYADAPKTNYGLVPLNSDGSVNVKLSPDDIVKVDIYEVDGNSVAHYNGKLKVEVEQ